MTPPATIPKALEALRAAKCPEDVFGDDATALKDNHRSWAKVVHPDKAPTKALKVKATEAFQLLSKLFVEAEARIARGTYGARTPSVLATLRTKTAAYDLTELTCNGELDDVYSGKKQGGPACVVRVCRTPINNELLKAEADILAGLPAKLPKSEHAQYFPSLLDSFEIQRGPSKVRANVLAPLPTGAVSLADVRAAFPKGLDPKDAAWMWNRLLEALHLLHCEGYVHGNVAPDRMFIVPDTHQGILTDYAYSVKVGSRAKAISPAWKAIYPPELLDKKGLDTSADLYMAAWVMMYLLGGEVGNPRFPSGTPVAIAGLLRACWLGRAHRTASAKELHTAFKEVRKGLRWPKGFRPFNLPTL